MLLVADDDPDLVTLIARRLRKAGYEVITASEGEDDFIKKPFEAQELSSRIHAILARSRAA